MIITYFGHSCFRIQDKIGPEGVSLATDPFNKSLGIKLPNFEADIITVSHNHNDHNNVSALRGNPFVIDSAGEYEVKGIMIFGLDSKHDDKGGAERGDNVIYRIKVDEITVAHLGDLGHILNDDQLDKLDGVDILFVPVGGKYTLDAKKAVEVISQIEPRLVIPMHYKTRGVKLDVEPVDKFVKELGIEPKTEDKLKINKKDLPPEGMDLVILNF